MVSTMEKHYIFKSLFEDNITQQRCVFHCATYKDVGMALKINRLIVSAPPCTNSSVGCSIIHWYRITP
jgi:hypothetical protein